MSFQISVRIEILVRWHNVIYNLVYCLLVLINQLLLVKLLPIAWIQVAWLLQWLFVQIVIYMYLLLYLTWDIIFTL